MTATPIGYVRLVIHDEEDTPQEFVIRLLRSVFSMSMSDAVELVAAVEVQGRAVCGSWPRPVAEALLQAAEEYVRASGHFLKITAEPTATS
jgi:ATP-dependent Clp protease adapter protein ClpS